MALGKILRSPWIILEILVVGFKDLPIKPQKVMIENDNENAIILQWNLEKIKNKGKL